KLQNFLKGFKYKKGQKKIPMEILACQHQASSMTRPQSPKALFLKHLHKASIKFKLYRQKDLRLKLHRQQENSKASCY
ncbi:hypothetical protein DD594_27730, partial [Enterobacter cloacae complex sp. 4DZ1-17B1]